MCFSGLLGGNAVLTSEWEPTETTTTAQSGECHVSYSGPCQAGVTKLSVTKAPTAAPTTAAPAGYGAPTQAPTENDGSTASDWETLKVNDQGRKTDITDDFTPFTTNAIRLQYTGTREQRFPYFRVAEIIAYDTAGNKIAPLGARTDSFLRNWRKNSLAPELFDGSLLHARGSSVHFNKYATVWFDKDVTIASLRVAMPRAPRSDWAWQKFTGDGLLVAPTQSPTRAPTPVSAWFDLKVNDQGRKAVTVDAFTPFMTSAIHLTGISGNIMRVSEIIAYDTEGKKIAPAGARTDWFHPAWRENSLAPELYNEDLSFSRGSGVHMRKGATVWFGEEVTIAKLELHQHTRANTADWSWSYFNDAAEGTYTDGVSKKASGVRWSSGRIHDFDALDGTAIGDWVANRFSWVHCRGAAQVLSDQCYTAAHPGSVTTSWVRWLGRNPFHAVVSPPVPMCTPSRSKTNVFTSRNFTGSCSCSLFEATDLYKGATSAAWLYQEDACDYAMDRWCNTNCEQGVCPASHCKERADEGCAGGGTCNGATDQCWYEEKETVLLIKSSVAFQGVGASAFDTTEGLAPLIEALASALGVNESQVEIANVATTSSSSRRLGTETMVEYQVVPESEDQAQLCEAKIKAGLAHSPFEDASPAFADTIFEISTSIVNETVMTCESPVGGICIQSAAVAAARSDNQHLRESSVLSGQSQQYEGPTLELPTDESVRSDSGAADASKSGAAGATNRGAVAGVVFAAVAVAAAAAIAVVYYRKRTRAASAQRTAGNVPANEDAAAGEKLHDNPMFGQMQSSSAAIGAVKRIGNKLVAKSSDPALL
jgi:hypothetical protein